MASDTSNDSDSYSPSMTTFLVAVIIWISCTINTQGLRGLLREIASTARYFVEFLWVYLCKTVLEQSIPLHADDRPKWRVLTALHGTLGTMTCSMIVISLAFAVFKRRVLHGLALWIPTLLMGYVGFIIHLYWIGGHGWEKSSNIACSCRNWLLKREYC